MKTRQPVLLAAAATAVAAGVALYAKSRRYPPLKTVLYVDLDRYAGLWYEIARLPASFEQDCEGVTARYTLRPDGKLTVVNVCHKFSPDGEVKKVEGTARVVDPETNAKLKVSFFWPFEGDYWILALDPDYQFALVGEPSREKLWLLSRTPDMPGDVRALLIQEGRKKGFPVEDLLFTEQRPT